MFFLLLQYLIITSVCIAAGLLYYSFRDPGKGNFKSAPLLFLTGVCLMGMWSQLFSLFVAVDADFFGISVAILLLLLLARRKVVQHSVRLSGKGVSTNGTVLVATITLVVLVFNAGPTMMDDTESYHIQMVKWVYEFGTVKGIANLHERFGFHSSWFTLNSFFYFPWSRGNYYTALNGTVSVWMGIYLTSMAYSASDVRKKFIPYFACLILCLLAWPLIRGNAATGNYDFITVVMLFVLFTRAWQEEEMDQAEWILWPLFLCSVRLINFPVLLLTAFVVFKWMAAKNWRYVSIAIATGILFILPFAARNLMLSGYPFYPSRAFNVFNVDWKVRPQVIEYLLDYIKYYNRVNTSFMSLPETRALSTPAWIPVWFKFLFSYDKLILIPGIIGYLVALMQLRGLSAQRKYLLLVMFAQLIAWFWIAPDPRFVYGPLLCGFFLAVYYGAQKVQTNRMVQTACSVVLSTAIIVYSGFKLRDEAFQNFISPRSLPVPPVTEVRLQHIKLQIPSPILNNWNPRCYDLPLPCLYVVDSALQQRGSSVRDGFRIKN
jgi:hypothetical protein